MRVGKLNQPLNLVLIKTKDYLIDWDKDGSSKPEITFRNLIRPYWQNYIVLFQLRIPGSLLRVDFVNVSKKIAVEISPVSHHGTYNSFFHKERTNFYKSLQRDQAKFVWLEQNKFQILELNDEDLDKFSPKYINEKFGISIL